MKINTITVLLSAFFLFQNCKKETAVAEQTKVKTDSAKVSDTVGSGYVHWEDPEIIDAGKFIKFKGAWFDVEYPAAFSARGSSNSSTSDENFDSAFFTSPDGSVEFYIFSPQWTGKADDIKRLNTEKLTDSTHQSKGNLSVDRWTIAAKDGSYQRSYQQTSGESGQKIFGIKYKNERARQKYTAEYDHFKKSLRQYAD